jgi:LmbE family N-acetylglucosaminyl deacetylase
MMLSVAPWKRWLSPIKWVLIEQMKAVRSRLLRGWLRYWGSQPLVLSPHSILVFAPHPDDETLGCGGLIAAKRSQQIPVHVVVITDGQGSHPFVDGFSSSEIATIRKQEAIAALDKLGVESNQVFFLDQPDGTLNRLPETQYQALIQQICQLLINLNPQEVYVTHAKDCHTDHEATFAAVQVAIAQTGINVQLFQYPIWLLWDGLLGKHYQPADLVGAYRLDISSVLPQKQQALQAYASQIKPLVTGSNSALPPDFLRQALLPYELYFRAPG